VCPIISSEEEAAKRTQSQESFSARAKKLSASQKQPPESEAAKPGRLLL